MSCSCARVLFSTHFLQLKYLANQYPERLRHVIIQASKSNENGENVVLSEVDGSGGIRLAQACGMPTEIITRAGEFRDRLEAFSKVVEPQLVVVDNDPVSEVFKVLQAIEEKTLKASGERNFAEAKRLLEELKKRLL